MNELIDMQQVVKELGKRPRGRSCFVFTQDKMERHGWAKQLAEMSGVEHLDLVSYFIEHRKLAEKVSSFDVNECFKLFTEEAKSEVLIVTGIEFLKAMWSSQDRSMEQLATKMEMWNKKPAILMVMQYDKSLAEREYSRFPQLRMIIHQNKTKALKSVQEL